MSEQNAEEVLARFEELTLLEAEFDDVELELIKKAEALNAPLYKKRAEVIAKIPHFWALVFEQSPPEVDNFIQPSDSKVFAECLQTIEVTRFELNDPKGSPRSFSIKFGFGPNEYFEDAVLEKKFYFRRALDGWIGLVSDPVKIQWKKGKDLTGGLTDAAYDLFLAKQKLPAEKKGHFKAESNLKEYKALANKIELSEEASVSFFAWFGYVSSWRYVTPEESEKAFKAEDERMEKRKKGEKVDDDEPNDEDDQHDHQETEVFPQGDELATIIAEDVWPSAIKYYKHAHEADDEELSDLDEIEDFDDDDSDGEMDIRALVGKGKGNSDSPPAKKQRKS